MHSPQPPSRLSQGSHTEATEIHKKYIDMNFDFGLSIKDLKALVGDEKSAEQIMTAFKSSSGFINALALITGAALCADGTFAEKSTFIFACFDFDDSNKISYEELVILIMSATKGLSVMTQLGSPPNDLDCESLAKEAFHEVR
jgi:hypothetical protein